MISKKPISLLDTELEMVNMGLNGAPGFLSIEDALDLSLCMSFNPVNLSSKERFNPFKVHYEQR